MNCLKKTALISFFVFIIQLSFAQDQNNGEINKPKNTVPEEKKVEFEYTTHLINTLDEGKQPKKILNEKDRSWMVLIPAGEFSMGTNEWKEQGGREDESPEHKVFLNTFYIDQYEITNKQYIEFCKESGNVLPQSLSDPKYNDPDQPAVGITHEQASEYAKWAGKRLPTEAEWEKAARGTDGRTYPWGNEWDKNACNNKDLGLKKTTKIGSYEKDKSPYDVYDMAGNVSELVADCYDSKFYSKSPEKNPKCESNDSAIVKRGGNYYYDIKECRTTEREGFIRTFSRLELGFRCVKDFEIIKESQKVKEEKKPDDYKVEKLEKKLIVLESQFTDIFKKDGPLPESFLPNELKKDSNTSFSEREKVYIYFYNLTNKKISVSIANEEGLIPTYNKILDPNSGKWTLVSYSPNFFLYYKRLEGEPEVKRGGYFNVQTGNITNLIFDPSLFYQNADPNAQTKPSGARESAFEVTFGKFKPSFKDVAVINDTDQEVIVAFKNDDKFTTLNEFVMKPGTYYKNPFMNANYHVQAKYLKSPSMKFRSDSFGISASGNRKQATITNTERADNTVDIDGVKVNGLTVKVTEFSPVDLSKF